MYLFHMVGWIPDWLDTYLWVVLRQLLCNYTIKHNQSQDVLRDKLKVTTWIRRPQRMLRWVELWGRRKSRTLQRIARGPGCWFGELDTSRILRATLLSLVRTNLHNEILTGWVEFSGRRKMLQRMARRARTLCFWILWTEPLPFLLVVDHVPLENLHLSNEHLKSEGKPPSSCPSGQHSASSLKSGHSDYCITSLVYQLRQELFAEPWIVHCHTVRFYYNIVDASRNSGRFTQQAQQKKRKKQTHNAVDLPGKVRVVIGDVITLFTLTS